MLVSRLKGWINEYFWNIKYLILDFRLWIFYLRKNVEMKFEEFIFVIIF